MPRISTATHILGLSLSITLLSGMSLHAGVVPPGEPAVDKDAAAKILDNNDCRACHLAKENLVGPSYFAIADRLRYDKTKIAAAVLKVQKGSNGKSSYTGLKTSIAIMTPHPQLSPTEIENLIRYMILESSWSPETAKALAKDPPKK